jgi:hypothetical protein
MCYLSQLNGAVARQTEICHLELFERYNDCIAMIRWGPWVVSAAYKYLEMDDFEIRKSKSVRGLGLSRCPRSATWNLLQDHL